MAAAEAASGAWCPGEGSRGEHGTAGLGGLVLGAWGQSGGPGTLRATRGCAWPGCVESLHLESRGGRTLGLLHSRVFIHA